MASADLDRDGSIDFSEFLSLAGRWMRQPLNEADLLAAFDSFDGNSDGFLSADELYRALNALGLQCTRADSYITLQNQPGTLKRRRSVYCVSPCGVSRRTGSRMSKSACAIPVNAIDTSSKKPTAKTIPNENSLVFTVCITEATRLAGCSGLGARQILLKLRSSC